MLRLEAHNIGDYTKIPYTQQGGKNAITNAMGGICPRNKGACTPQCRINFISLEKTEMDMKKVLLAALLCTVAFMVQATSWRTAMANYNFTEAIKILDIKIDSLYAIKDTASLVPLLREKVSCQKSLYKFNDAIGTIEQIMGLAEQDAPTIASLAECHRLNGNNNAAVLFYNIAVQTDPQNLFYKIQLANLQYRMEDYTGSLSTGKQILQRDSIEAIMSLVGNSFNKLDQADSALAYYSAVYRKNNADFRSLDKIANIFLSRKMYDTVLVMTGEYLSRDTANTVINPIKGLVLYSMKKWNEASDAFKKSILYGCDKASGYYYIGLCRMNIGDYWAAVNYFLLAQKEDSKLADDPEFVLNMAYCNGKWRDYSTADSLFDVATNLLQPDSSIMYNVNYAQGEIYYEKGMGEDSSKKVATLKKAVKHYKEALRYAPSRIVICTRIGYCLRLAGNYKEALKYYEKYLSEGKKGSYTWNFVQDEIAFIKEETFMQQR